MTFVYFASEFYRISNTIACGTLILNYNGKFNLGIYHFFFKIYIFMLQFLKLIYIYFLKSFYLTMRFDC